MYQRSGRLCVWRNWSCSRRHWCWPRHRHRSSFETDSRTGWPLQSLSVNTQHHTCYMCLHTAVGWEVSSTVCPSLFFYCHSFYSYLFCSGPQGAAYPTSTVSRAIYYSFSTSNLLRLIRSVPPSCLDTNVHSKNVSLRATLLGLPVWCGQCSSVLV